MSIIPQHSCLKKKPISNKTEKRSKTKKWAGRCEKKPNYSAGGINKKSQAKQAFKRAYRVAHFLSLLT